MLIDVKSPTLEWMSLVPHCSYLEISGPLGVPGYQNYTVSFFVNVPAVCFTEFTLVFQLADGWPVQDSCLYLPS